MRYNELFENGRIPVFSHPESQGRDDQQLYESDFSLPLTWKQAFFCGEPMYEGYDIYRTGQENSCPSG
jgi:hypothetical protein